MPISPAPTLTDCVTLADIALRVGSYSTAYSLAVSGLFGEPVAKVGRSNLYSARAVDSALAARAQAGTSPESR